MKPVMLPKNDRINLRLKHDAKLLLERAANFEGQTVSKFILSSALIRAEQTIQAHETMHLNSNDSKKFLKALSQPVKFQEQLTAALNEHGKRIKTQ